MKKYLLTLFAFFLLPFLSISQEIEWQNTIGGNGSDWLLSISQTKDGGYILGGYSSSNISGDKTENSNGFTVDYWIVKIDINGNVQWENTIGGDGSDELTSIIQTSDGGYILGGSSNSDISADKTENNIGNDDYWIVKTDSLGNIQWQNTIGGSWDDQLSCIIQSNDGGYLLGGYSSSPISGDKTEANSGYDYWIVKTDSVGVFQWDNTIGGNNGEILYSIAQTSDGGYVLGGSSASNISGDKTENSNGDYDFWVIKTDNNGSIQWQNTIGGNGFDTNVSVTLTNDGGCLLGGSSNSIISGDKTEACLGYDDYWILKIDSLGNIQWQNTIGANGEDKLNSVSHSLSGGYILGGYSDSDISGDKTENCNGLYDYWIVKINGNPTSIPELLNEAKVLQTYPNPANSTLTIETRTLMASGSKLTVTDVAGRTLLSKTLDGNVTKHQIDISSFSSGIYFVQLDGGKGISRGKFVKE